MERKEPKDDRGASIRAYRLAERELARGTYVSKALAEAALLLHDLGMYPEYKPKPPSEPEPPYNPYDVPDSWQDTGDYSGRI